MPSLRHTLAVFDFIDGWYNPHRLHSAPGYVSPAEYKRRKRRGLMSNHNLSAKASQLQLVQTIPVLGPVAADEVAEAPRDFPLTFVCPAIDWLASPRR
jgi:hypothetical protein